MPLPRPCAVSNLKIASIDCVPARVTVRGAVVDGVVTGKFPQSRIDASVRRLLAAKHEMGLDRQRFVDLQAMRSTVARDLQRVALGEVKVTNPPQPPPPPKAELELPEPFSLLAIPVDDGSLRSWFASPEVADAR